MINLGQGISLPDNEIELQAIRSQGAGGQNVNKVATAIHLRFSIPDSSLPDRIKARLLGLADHRISKDGILVIKAQQHRSQEQNREDALARLRQLVARASKPRKKRVATRPTRASKRRRLDNKKRQGQRKKLRGRVDPD